MKDMKINMHATPILLKTSINQILKPTTTQLHSYVIRKAGPDVFEARGEKSEMGPS